MQQKGDAAEIIAGFGAAWDDRAWQPSEGRMARYLRSDTDEGWRMRMKALQQLVDSRSGPSGTMALRSSLGTGSAPSRALAAQSLGYRGDLTAANDLMAAAERDPDPIVRLYAVDSLGMLGGTTAHSLFKRLAESETNADVRRHLSYALERQGEGLDPAIASQLQQWDPATLAIAEVGELAPDFTLKSLTNESVRLRDFRGKSAVILVFMYGDTCPVCHGQLAQLRGKIKDFRSAGAELFFIDPHEVWSGRHFLDKLGLQAAEGGQEVLLDPALLASAAYGVAMQMRIHTQLSNRPATFIVDSNGVLRYERRAKHFADRPSADELLHELKMHPDYAP